MASTNNHTTYSMFPLGKFKVVLYMKEIGGNAGSAICWNYVHDRKACVAKEIIEAIDDENNSTTFKIIEGDLMTEYRNFKAVVQAVRWNFEYEKLNGSVGEPRTLLEFCIHLSKEIDDHLCHA